MDIDIVALWHAVRPLWLVWMVVLFGLIVFWVLRPGNRRRFEEDGMIPFKDGSNGG